MQNPSDRFCDWNKLSEALAEVLGGLYLFAHPEAYAWNAVGSSISWKLEGAVKIPDGLGVDRLKIY